MLSHNNKFIDFNLFVCMAFAQLTYRESLRDIEACLGAMHGKLYHMGIHCKVLRSTLADANKNRDWRIYADFAQVLIHIARDIYQDELFPESGSFYIMDRAYIDFERLYTFTQASAFFVTRSNINLNFRRLYSHPIDKSTGLRCDQIIALDGIESSKCYPEKLRRIRYFDSENKNNLTFKNQIVLRYIRKCC